MPRTGEGSRSPSPSRSSSYSQAPLRKPQQQQAKAPQQTQSSGGMFSGLGGVLAQGMAFGAGSEIAHQAIRSVTGGGSHGHVDQSQGNYDQGVQQQQQQQANKCDFENTNFISCLKDNNDSISMCQNYFDMLKDCEKKFS